ncbi:hypothetical protein Gorai_006561 [Gossypium raimondii]|uniref:Uncharacterized protein n=1 Tax=Gossypium raimondii TaxID=29730 RepID=A0A7J8QGE6_GOSRA|nr:hypothetical protein [Gossypium raimondii]
MKSFFQLMNHFPSQFLCRKW